MGRLDGYGPVADAILYHHERVDGAGYPAGLIGNEIPLASRIVAICSTYDTLTARETYRSPMTPQDAMAELRRVAGRQLDSELVDSFVAMLQREGPELAGGGQRGLRRRARLRAAGSADGAAQARRLTAPRLFRIPDFRTLRLTAEGAQGTLRPGAFKAVALWPCGLKQT